MIIQKNLLDKQYRIYFEVMHISMFYFFLVTIGNQIENDIITGLAGVEFVLC